MLPKIDYKGNTFSPKCNTFRLLIKEAEGHSIKLIMLKYGFID